MNCKIRYEKAEQPFDQNLTFYRVLQDATFQLPAIFDNDCLSFTYDEKKQDSSYVAYRFLPEATGISYVFSRGYDYEIVPHFQKVTGEYVFPIACPCFNMGGWYYLRRIYSKGFFDSTYIDTPQFKTSLNSYGFEIYLESQILRFLSMTFEVRVLQRQLDNIVRCEGFLS